MYIFRIIRAWIFKARVKWAFNSLKIIDRKFLLPLPRWRRKQFWENFHDRIEFRNVTFDNIPGLEWISRKKAAR